MERGLKWKGAALSVLGAGVGAFLWYLLASATGNDYVWLTIGIGGLCGFGSILGASDGPIAGGLCAFLTLIAGCIVRAPFYGSFDGLIEETGLVGVLAVKTFWSSG